jgi:hypothetical protein
VSAGTKKRHPALDHRTDRGWSSLLQEFFCVCGLAKLFFLSTRATIASRPVRPLTFFTIAFLADVTGVERRLVRYFWLSAVFTVPINSIGIRAHLLCPRFLGLLLSARGCYPCRTHLTRAWFVLSLLPAHELPLSHRGLRQWLRKIRAMPPWGIGVLS